MDWVNYMPVSVRKVIVKAYDRRERRNVCQEFRGLILLQNFLHFHLAGKDLSIDTRSSNSLRQTVDSLSSNTARAYRKGISESRDHPKNARNCCRASFISTSSDRI